MKTLLWLLALVALAVGLVIAGRYNTGYVLLALPKHRIEVSLNLFLILLAAGFTVAYWTVRATAAAMRLPAKVREYRAMRERERARSTLIEALEAFFEGRYAKAETAAAAAMSYPEYGRLGAVLAARAAHQLRAPDRRDRYLAAATQGASAEDALTVVTQAELLLDEWRHQDALAVLSALPRKHTAALRLELRAQQLARNWDRTLEIVSELERRGVLDAVHAQRVRRHARVEALKRRATDAHALAEAWRRVPEAERRDPAVAGAAARGYLALGDRDTARDIIEQSLLTGWDSALALLYADCAGADSVRQIERAEGWLKAHPADAALLLSLGKLCVRQELWGKAQNYLDASVAVEPTWEAHLSAARLHERLGNSEASAKHTRASLDLATRALREKTPGTERP